MTDQLKDFGAAFKGFLNQMAAQAPAEEPVFLRVLRDHFGSDPAGLPIVGEDFASSDHPNVQIAIEDFLASEGCSAELVGVNGGPESAYRGVSLAGLITRHGNGLFGGSGPSPGPVQYVNIGLHDGKVLACVQCGLYLIRDAGARLALLMRGSAESYRPGLHLEVMAPERAAAEQFFARLRTAIRKRNVYRGQVISLTTDNFHNVHVRYHRLPQIEAGQIILPQGLLSRIERQTMGFAQHGAKLLAAGRHLKRGILLYGPPGTGKTLTAMYLASRMRDRTVLLLTGRGLGLIEQSCAMARLLQPAIVILEDVDLVAEERTRSTATCTALLFELLNQMDGLADDADILFLLTTNRPEILEPALASRPGRVDQAIEIPPPDAECRRRLFDLYGRGLDLRVTDLERFVARTEGVSAAFIRELVRKAALFAADEADGLVVTDRHLDEALHELVVDGGPLTKSLLGVRAAADGGA